MTVYLDYNATTPVDPRVMGAMLPYFTEKFGNAASRNHPFGWEAEEAVDGARKTVANELNASPREIVFTSGATESVNLALKGVAQANRDRGRHLVTQVTEHRAVLDTCKWLEEMGWDVTYLPVEPDGRVDPGRVASAVREETVMVTVMHANNEIGVLNPIEEIGSICQEKGVIFAVDAAQSFAKLPIDVKRMKIHLLAGSGHKIYGPKGIGFLYVRSRGPKIRLERQMEGGGHEGGMRSGTLPVPLVVGMAEAVRILQKERDEENERLKALRDRLLAGIQENLPHSIVNGSMEHRLPHNLNVSFPGVDGESLLMGMKQVACSTGSACSSATLEPSYVIQALGRTEQEAYSAVRLSVGRFTTEAEIDTAVTEIVTTVKKLSRLVTA
ncbi:MAG: cysteine desulfurase family protein [Fidelibacterota bacterium]